ncbi:MAG: TonB-dependent receptor plug domain-containing protein [Bacteroidaceae bacterium]|nr:TonB-dependent receptor plug domain-containing protein [Bacteroidaceae bacterium]
MRRILFILLAFLACQGVLAQKISGVVLKKGKPKKGVTVWLKKADKAVDTDKEGRFSFTGALADDTLQITAGARADAKILVGNHKDIIVNLDKNDFTVKEDDVEQTLKYTLLSRATGASDGVTHEMIMRSGLRTITELLRNYVAGVMVVTEGGSSKVTIRGINSVNSGTEPLVVLDGVAIEGFDLDNAIPVETIATIKVNKDGAGWGVRGANGVILITTLK